MIANAIIIFRIINSQADKNLFVANWTMLLGENSWIGMGQHSQFAAECARCPHSHNQYQSFKMSDLTIGEI